MRGGSVTGRSLYLSDGANAPVVRRDGPSVWIERKGSAGQRVPARLLGRVVIIGNVRLDAEALTLFTESDIPVIFLNRRAEESAVAMSYNHRLPGLYESQRALADDPAKAGRYRQWAQLWRERLQHGILRRLYKPISPQFRAGVKESDYQEVISYLKPNDKEKWAVVSDFVNNLMRGIILERIIKAGLDPHPGIIHRTHLFGFALDMCYILGAETDCQCVQFFRSSINAPALDHNYRISGLTESAVKNLVHRFENKRIAIQVLIRDIINEFMDMLPAGRQ